MGDRIWPLSCPCLNPQTCERVILDGKRDFADVKKLRILRWGDYLDYPGGTNVITRVLIRGRQEMQSMRKRCADGNRGHSDVDTSQRM